MRGGTSKGVFFRPEDLPPDPVLRDRVLLRLMGSPDPYGRQMDGMGGGYSSASKVALVSRSGRSDCDIDYFFGQVSVEKPLVDWSGGCGNLLAAVAAFAIQEGMVQVPRSGFTAVRIWQVNLDRSVTCHVPIADGEVQEDGDLRVDGVAFPGAEIRIEYPVSTATVFPTGRPIDRVSVPGVGMLEMTLIDAGMPTAIVDAATLGLRGVELPADINADAALLERLEHARTAACVAMGLADSVEAASATRLHTPKLAFVSRPVDHPVASGHNLPAGAADVTARIVSMGKLHHAMTGTGGISIAAASRVPGTVVSRLGRPSPGGVRIGHASGTLMLDVELREQEGTWCLLRAALGRTARCLMRGSVHVPGAVWPA